MKDDNCEYDCKHVCVGCDKTFCEIKDEYDMKHEDEIVESLQLNCGDYYCHPDCFRDCH